jgi:xanthine/CO dehydrogenase XdhC/CoxF family maturation factor
VDDRHDAVQRHELSAVRVLVGLTAVATLLVGVFVVVGDRSEPSPAVAPGVRLPSYSPSQRQAEPATSAAVDGVAQARAAAVEVVSSMGAVVAAGRFSRRDLVESFATAEFGPTLAEETTRAVTALEFEVGQVPGGRMVVVEQPVTASAEAVAADRVQVSVWSVLVIAVPGRGIGRAMWRTVTVDMALVEGRWLVDSWRSTPGPAPAPTADLLFADASELAVPMQWPAAHFGMGE